MSANHLRTTLVGAVLLVVILTSATRAQEQLREYPVRDYYLAQALFADGEFRTAADGFRSAQRAGIRTPLGRWVDSICYHTMLGECFREQGEYTLAVEQYDAALNLVLTHRHWMLRLKFHPPVVPRRIQHRDMPTWGESARKPVVGQYPDRYHILVGSFNQQDVLVKGGIVPPLPEYYTINANEIARCIALSIQRRGELMGQACKHSELTNQVITALTVRLAPPNTWGTAWASAWLGLAYSSAGKDAQAVAELNKAIVALGQFDHPLTGMVLLELGKLNFKQGQFKMAGAYFLESSLTATWFGQSPLLGEALEWGALTHIVTGKDGMYQPLDLAILWQRRRFRFLEARLAIMAAEIALNASDLDTARGYLDRTRRAMTRSEMAEGEVGADYQYVVARGSYQTADMREGDAAFSRLMQFKQRSCQRLFELQLIDDLYTSGNISDRVANDLFKHSLREPTPSDWTVYPADTLAMVLTPHFDQREHWLEVALKRKENELAVEIADGIRRDRFYSSLPMGGRLLSLRWVLEAPKEALSEAALLQRQDLVARFPQYAELAKQASVLRAEIAGKSLVPDDINAMRDLKIALGKLEKIAQSEEQLLRDIALRRVACEFVFPPRLDFKKFQAELPPRKLVLAFLATRNGVHTFLVGQGKYSHWQLKQPEQVRGEIAKLLREMGHLDRNQAIDVEKFRDKSWRRRAAALLVQLTGELGADAWADYDELVIVPDRELWYLPFEALQIRRKDKTVPLLSQVRMRYAPTVALAKPDARGTSPTPETAVVTGPLYPRAQTDVIDSEYNALTLSVPEVNRLPDVLPSSSHIYSKFFDRLVVSRDIDDRATGAYAWAPMQIDRGKPGSSLGEWLSLPFGGPEQVLLPGYHTAAENALKQSSEGDEIFLSVCGLMATGARTILMSRWRTGGKTSYDLVREFTQELPYLPAADAWQRSAFLTMESEVFVDREPRVKAGNLDIGMKADHPFFWSGYLLVDTGSSPVVVDDKTDDVAARD